jgi:hypothetical protein
MEGSADPGGGTGSFFNIEKPVQISEFAWQDVGLSGHLF